MDDQDGILMNKIAQSARKILKLQKRKPARVDNSEKPNSTYESCMRTLLSAVEILHIVQIGANDGAINDPLFSFVKEQKKRTKIILVEPQLQLLPYLRANYAFHDSAQFFNGAVGTDSHLTLYCVNNSCWDKLVVPYAEGWPAYRAPTGLTSTSRSHVYDWLSQHLPREIDPDTVIDQFSVDCVSLEALLREHNFPRQIDVLQIDTEGYDDQVIYSANLECTRPRLINFEATHMDKTRFDDLEAHLIGGGYHVSRSGNDAIAIRTRL